MSVSFDQAVLEGLDASKPAASAGTIGRLYFATDTGKVYRDNGSAWVERANDLQLGTTATTAAAGNDSRLSDARTPTAHASTHESGGSDAFTGIVPGSAFAPAGLTGATAVSRYVGATASGAPASGTFAVGDFVIDQTAKIWICTVAGSPGTWTQLAGGGGGGAPTSTPYLTTASDATLTAEVVIPGLAASPDISGTGGGGTIAHEFDSGETAPTWSPSSPTSDINTTLKSHLYATWSESTERIGYYAWTPGSGAFEARGKIVIGDEETNNPGIGGAAGLHIGDSGNTNRLLIQVGQNGALQYSIASYTYTGGTYTQRGGNYTVSVPEVYFRITRDASNNISFYFSTQGKLWQRTATQAFTLTVAQIGLRLSSGSSLQHYMACDWLRTNV